uniref:Uncharacterized protein n=1 Tax=Alexandrium monilatum TaxID=311494 RepID=A0A7S4PXH1_9DINO
MAQAAALLGCAGPFSPCAAMCRVGCCHHGASAVVLFSPFCCWANRTTTQPANPMVWPPGPVSREELQVWRSLRATGRDAGTVRKHGLDLRFESSCWFYSKFWRRQYSSWEPGTFRVLEQFARGAVVLDVGAWIGPTALWAAHVARRVVALEPATKAFEELTANLRANPGAEAVVSPVKAALGTADEFMGMSNEGA